jgi:hypothetical protein
MKSEIQTGQDRKIEVLPGFKVKDCRGNWIDRSGLLGKDLYIQFVNPSISDDIALMKKALSLWSSESLHALFFTENCEELKAVIKEDINHMTVVSDKYDELLTKFNVPHKSGKFYLFNQNGKLLISSRNLAGYRRLKVYLNHYVKGKYFSIDDFIQTGKHIAEIAGFMQINDILTQAKKDYYIVVMFAEYCPTCASEVILAAVKDIYHRNDSILPIIVLADSFGEQDVLNFKRNLDIDFPVLPAGDYLSRIWNSFIEEYSIVELTDIVILLDESGRVVKAADPNCDCAIQFLNDIRVDLKSTNREEGM